MPKASKSNRHISNDRTEPYATATSTSLRRAAMDTSNPTSTGASERSSASPWTEGEDRILMEARQKGLNWAVIANKHFPSKTSNACRKRHERLMDKRKSQDNWDVEVLAQAYMEVREHMWQILASKLSQNWQAVEGKCMEKGLKTLQNASRTVARRDKAMRDHRADSDDGSCHVDDPYHHRHHHRSSHSNHNGSDHGREELISSYRNDEIHASHPGDLSPSSARSSNTPYRTFSTAATTPTSYAPITAVSQGPSHVLPPMHSPYDPSQQNSTIPSIESILHPTPVTTH